MIAIFFFFFNPYRNLIHWRMELVEILITIAIIATAGIIISNLFFKYRRQKELSLHTKIFWGTVLIILLYLIIKCYENSNYLQQEGGAGAWLSLIISGLIFGLVFSYLIYGIYAWSSPLKRNFIIKKMKSIFTI
jgi:hypothetical protein